MHGRAELGGIVKRLGFVLACVVMVASACSLPSITPGTAGFPNGVAAGDVTASGATLWTRTSAEASVDVNVYDAVLPANSLLAVPGDTPVFTASSSTTADTDFTTKVQVGGLQPHHTYFYRFSNGSEQSQLGRFVTAPAADQAASFRFVVAADADGFPVGGPPAFNNFEVLGRARLDQPDFFSFLGDTIYSDSSYAPGPITTVDQYRDAHEQNRKFENLRNLMSATGTYAQIDDHEVYNDFDGQTVDPARYAAGLQAFNDWMPTNSANVLADPTCAGGHPRYFHQKWGTQAEIFQLDERSCRSSQDPVKAVCTPPDAALDLAPTAPALFARVRQPPGVATGRLRRRDQRSRTHLARSGAEGGIRVGPRRVDGEVQDRPERGRDPAVLRAALRPLGGLRRRPERDPELHPVARDRQRRVPHHRPARQHREQRVHRQDGGLGADRLRGHQRSDRDEHLPARDPRTRSRRAARRWSARCRRC